MLEPHVIAQLDQANSALKELGGIVANIYNILVDQGVPEHLAIGTAETLVLEALGQAQ